MRAGGDSRGSIIYILILLNIPRKSVHFFECLESILISIYLLRVHNGATAEEWIAFHSIQKF